MKQTPEKLSGTYDGYRILISASAALFVLSRIFTYRIDALLRIISLLSFLAFTCGMIGCADKLKQAGWQKRKRRQGLLAIPAILLLILLQLAALPLAIKSILTGTVMSVMLWYIKPQKRKEANQT